MRARLVVIGALLALAGAPTSRAGGCRQTLPHGPRVPAPVVVRTVCGVFELRHDGSVVYGRTPRSSPAWAPRATSHPGPGTWVAHPNRRLAVYRDGRLLWHSQVTGGSDDVAVGHGHVAFTVFRRYGMSLWIAPLEGRERKVAAQEQIVGWVPAGLVTQRGTDVNLRAADGHLLRRLANARTAFLEAGHAVILRTDGVIVRTDGWHTSAVVDLRRYGIAAYPWLEPIDGGLWEVQARNRVLFLERDGRRFASFVGAPIAGNVVVLPDRGAVLFVIHRRQGDADPGVMTVYRLDRGRRAAQPLFRSRVRRLACVEWGGLDYSRGRVLFSSNEADVAILDPAGHSRRIDLTGFVRRLLPRRQNPPEPSYFGWADTRG